MIKLGRTPSHYKRLSKGLVRGSDLIWSTSEQKWIVAKRQDVRNNVKFYRGVARWAG